ncbi:FmdE family protein [Desulfurobacterium sp.]|uniref:FmdE family protein n=1 Tax=Desulfurobacterium sp. TaxID=2004706 RepID=UPI00260CB909|nr:FmdE family protein [Desulfurobacterium sp.]
MPDHAFRRVPWSIQIFFEKIEKIKVKDELATFLGAGNGIFEYSYYDMVKITGHSCATVAGGYLIASEGLKHLYKDEIPVRGNIKVEISKLPTENNFGVIGLIISAITGAGGDDGFSGIPDGRFKRRGLLSFNANVPYDVVMTRLDNGKQVGINYNPYAVVNPKEILKTVLNPDATEEDIRAFPKKFQKMVATIFENRDKVITEIKLLR